MQRYTKQKLILIQAVGYLDDILWAQLWELAFEKTGDAQKYPFA